MPKAVVAIPFETPTITSSCCRSIAISPESLHPSSGPVIALEVKLEAPEIFVLKSVRKASGTSVMPSKRTSLDHYELLRACLDVDEALHIVVQNAGEVPAVCRGTLFVQDEVLSANHGIDEPSDDMEEKPIEADSKNIADSVLDEMVDEASGPDLPNPPEDEEVGFIEGLWRKCRGWFAEGFAAGVAGRASREEVADLVSSAPTVRESLRVLTMQLTSVVEIPLVAARMYWNQVAGLGEPIRRAVLSTGKVDVGPGEAAKIVVSSPWRFRPTGISIDDRSAPYFTITDIKVGQDSQPQSTCGGLPCSLFAASTRPALELDMDDAGPDKDVTIWVLNESSMPHAFCGAILAVILGP